MHKVPVLHAQLQSLGDTKAGAIEELRKDQMFPFQLPEHRRQLFLGQHHRQAALHARTAHLDLPGQFDFEHLSVVASEKSLTNHKDR